MEPHIYGVTEVNQLVKGLLDSAPALPVSYTHLTLPTTPYV